MYKVIVFQKKESTPSHENESFLKQIFSCFKVTSTWNISILMPAHLLRAQTRENLNLHSLKHSGFLWRRRCALHCEGKSVRVQLGYVEKLPTHFLLQLQNHLTSLQKHRPSVYKVNVQGGSNTLYKKQKGSRFLFICHIHNHTGYNQ